MEMGCGFRFIRLNEAIPFSYAHMLRNTCCEIEFIFGYVALRRIECGVASSQR